MIKKLITKKFKQTCSCESGGLYYTNKENIIKFLHFGIFIAELTIPDDAKIYRYGYKWKADKLIINKYYPIKEWNGWNEKSCLEAVKNNGCDL